jgi:hypothetical protein
LEKNDINPALVLNEDLPVDEDLKDKVILLEQQVEELCDKVETLSSRLNGISYLLKSVINNKSLFKLIDALGHNDRT